MLSWSYHCQIPYLFSPELHHLLSRKKKEFDDVIFIWAASRKKGPYGIFYKNVYFSFFWMNIILRLVCENLSRITVIISFLWSPKHGIYAAASFSSNMTSWCSRYDTQSFISVILYMYMNIIFIAKWLFDGNSEILHCSDVIARSKTLCKSENTCQHFTAKIWRHFPLR